MQLETDILDKRWYKFSKFVKQICKYLGGHRKETLFLILNNENQMLDLTIKTKGIHKVSNVLSFVIGQFDMLGELVLCYDEIKRNAKIEGVTFLNKLAHLVVHGVLHLFGYDHITDTDFEKMKIQEIKILKELGFEDPYIA